MKKQISTKLEAMLGTINAVILIMKKNLRRVMYLDHLIVQFSYKAKSNCSTNWI
jgi:hypothetical protein